MRGRLVRLGPLADALLTRHDNHPVVTRLAGQSLALAAALSTALKFRGSFSVQAKGDGPVPMLLADCTDTGALRGYARAKQEKLDALLETDPVAGRRRSFWAAATWRSPSTRGRTRTASRALSPSKAATWPRWRCTTSAPASSCAASCTSPASRPPDGWRAGALILEKIAGAGGIDPSLDEEAQEESWRTATMLAGTLTDAELLDDDAAAGDACCTGCSTARASHVDRARALSYGCRCSRARLVGILEGFPPDDLDHMAVDGDIVMTCEFCNFDFRFPRDDRARAEAP